MAQFSRQIGRKVVHWTDHSLDRWWERCEENGHSGRQNALVRLDSKLNVDRIEPALPPWCRISRFHAARAEGFIFLDDDSGFVVNRNANGDYVAVTYIERPKALA